MFLHVLHGSLTFMCSKIGGQGTVQAGKCPGHTKLSTAQTWPSRSSCTSERIIWQCSTFLTPTPTLSFNILTGTTPKPCHLQTLIARYCKRVAWLAGVLWELSWLVVFQVSCDCIRSRPARSCIGPSRWHEFRPWANCGSLPILRHMPVRSRSLRKAKVLPNGSHSDQCVCSMDPL